MVVVPGEVGARVEQRQDRFEAPAAHGDVQRGFCEGAADLFQIGIVRQNLAQPVELEVEIEQVVKVAEGPTPRGIQTSAYS